MAKQISRRPLESEGSVKGRAQETEGAQSMSLWACLKQASEKGKLKESDSCLQILEDEEKVRHLLSVFLMLELGQKNVGVTARKILA